jgi:hypothetical protein
MFVVHFYCNINQRRKLLYLFTQCDISYWTVERKLRRHMQQKILHPFSKVVSFRVSHLHITQKKCNVLQSNDSSYSWRANIFYFYIYE